MYTNEESITVHVTVDMNVLFGWKSDANAASMMVRGMVDMNVVFGCGIMYSGASIDSLEFKCNSIFIMGCGVHNGTCGG